MGLGSGKRSRSIIVPARLQEAANLSSPQNKEKAGEGTAEREGIVKGKGGASQHQFFCPNRLLFLAAISAYHLPCLSSGK